MVTEESVDEAMKEMDSEKAFNTWLEKKMEEKRVEEEEKGERRRKEKILEEMVQRERMENPSLKVHESESRILKDAEFNQQLQGCCS